MSFDNNKASLTANRHGNITHKATDIVPVSEEIQKAISLLSLMFLFYFILFYFATNKLR